MIIKCDLIKNFKLTLFRGLCFGLFALLIQCKENKKKTTADHVEKTELNLKVKYAKGFQIIEKDSFTIVNVFFPNNRQKILYQYLIIKRGNGRPPGYPDAIVVETPVRSFIALSTMYVAYADQLNVLKQLKGISELKYVNSPRVLQLHARGEIKDLGNNSSLNIETIYALNPEIIICYTYGNSDYEIHPKLRQAGLRLAVHAEQLETTPLGRMEWIKFFALLFEKEKLADSLFLASEKSYQEIKNRASKATKSPKVFADIKYGDTWFMPGGRSYLAGLLSDAHTSYLWSADTNTGSIPLSFEAVYERAHDADYWINLSDWHNKNELAQSDHRYEKFKAFKRGNLFNYNKRVNKFKGNDYWESGMLHPEWILADLVKIFHPELLPEHELIYYKKLADE